MTPHTDWKRQKLPWGDIVEDFYNKQELEWIETLISHAVSERRAKDIAIVLNCTDELLPKMNAIGQAGARRLLDSILSSLTPPATEKCTCGENSVSNSCPVHGGEGYAN